MTPGAVTPEELDRRALERAAAGETEAFGRLVERHQDRLLRVCQGFLHDPEEARDAVQDVFLKAYRRAGGYRPRGKVYTWLYRIAVNDCLNKLRRRKIVRFLPLTGGRKTGPDDPPEPEPADPRPGPADRLDARRRWDLTRRALDELPESQRSVVILAKLAGLSQRETAAVLGITEGAVESRLFRALRKLEAVVEQAQESAR